VTATGYVVELYGKVCIEARALCAWHPDGENILYPVDLGLYVYDRTARVIE